MDIDAQVFLESVRPALTARNPETLAQLVREKWDARQVCRLLTHPEVDVRRVAAVALGLVGDERIIPPLARALRDPDPHVNRMAEHSLWSVWFRLGSASTVGPFQRGIELMAQDLHAQAINSFAEAIRIDPDFAEAWNQTAIACYLQGDFTKSLRCACRAASLMPYHFGSIAGLGHCYAELGDLERALMCYRKALQINPRMAGVQNAIEKIQARLTVLNGASGVFDAPTLRV